MRAFTDGTHLTAESESDLHLFASQIGLEKEVFQKRPFPNYPLIGRTKHMALAMGAVLVSTRELSSIHKTLKI